MIPLISNIAITEVSSSGTLNTKAGNAVALPVQYFKLTGNISGNLLLSNNANHKKIILDTNGYSITNSAGAPITSNSSATVELVGSGNIQSTLKTFTSSVATTTNTGTTTITAADSSTLLIDDSHTYDTTGVVSGITVGAVGEAGNNTVAGNNGVPRLGSNFSPPFRPTGYTSATFRTAINWPAEPSTATDAPTGVYVTFVTKTGNNLEGRTYSSSTGVVVTGNTASGFTVVMGPDWTRTGTNSDGNGYFWYSGTATASSGSGPYAAGHQLYISERNNTGTNTVFGIAASGILSFDATSCTVTLPNAPITGTGRKFTYTNNLAIPVVLTGNDPFNDVTVTAGATSIATRNTTDGSFSLTGTISGNNGSSQPYALTPINNGTGSINTDRYTGTLSASAL
jgi:hypothetical protein